MQKRPRSFDFVFDRSETIRRRAPDKNVTQAERSLRVKSTTQSKPARRISIQVRRSHSSRFVRKVFCNPWMAGKRDSHWREPARAICTPGKCPRKAEIAGVVRIRSPSRRSWISRIFIEAAAYDRGWKQ